MAEDEKFEDEALGDDAVLTRDYFPVKPLPEGVYDFTVAGCVVRDFDKTEKTPRCKGAVVTLRVTSGDGKRSRNVKKWFRFTKFYEPRLCAFLRSVGLKKIGEGASLSLFPESVGRSGKGYFTVSEDGRFNDLKYFLDPASGESIEEPEGFEYGGAPYLTPEEERAMEELFGKR
ncbi:MAG: hypothetical protein LUD72_08995 [Bacteroidales bacterium]|nr:hypothetical protein [Bacteroidales bacterium]